MMEVKMIIFRQNKKKKKLKKSSIKDTGSYSCRLVLQQVILKFYLGKKLK